MDHPIICFGQQPCGIFPKRFLFAKILAARRLQKEIGGEIVFFFHDSDHDPRETITILRDRNSNQEVALNFQFENRIQRQFSPLYAKRVRSRVAGENCAPTSELCWAVSGHTLQGDQMLERRRLSVSKCTSEWGCSEGVRVERSSSADFRTRAVAVSDYFVDQRYEGEIVRARYRDGKLLLHKGGDRFLEIPVGEFGPEQISPTARYAFPLDAISDSMHSLRRRCERAALHQQG